MKKIAINTNPNANQTTNRSAFSVMELVFVIVIIGIMAGVSIWYLPRTELKQAGETMINNLKYTKTLAQLDDRQFLMRDDKYLDEVRKLSDGEKKTVMKGQMQNIQRGLWQFQFHETTDLTGKKPDSTRSAQTYTIYSELASTSEAKPFDGRPMNGDIIAQDPMTKQCISGYSGTNLRNCTDNYGYAKEARFYDTYQTQVDNIDSNDCRTWNKGNTFAIYFDSNGKPYCKVSNEGNIVALSAPITIRLKRKNEVAYICITKGGIIEGGVLVGKDGQPQKDKEGRMRGIPVGNNGKCQDI